MDLPESRRGLIINQSADAIFHYPLRPDALDEGASRQRIVQGLEGMVDQYAGTQVSHLFFNTCYQRTTYPSEVWESYWDGAGALDIRDWGRVSWVVHLAGVDAFELCIRRCRQRGISPWLSLRMNDTHYSDEQHRMSALWWDHPEWRLPGEPHNGFDYAVAEVRDHYLALIDEHLNRYDADGLELDWMRFPWYFRRGQEASGRDLLNAFMREARRLADEAATRRGHPVRIAARVPAVPEFAFGLGMDGVTWAREGFADMLVLSPLWQPSDTDQPIERWREQIGSAAGDCVLASCTDLWLLGTPGGMKMMSDAASLRGFTAAMLERGADQIYLFNHFDRSYIDERSGPGTYDWIINEGASLDTVLDKRRRHVLTWHDPSPPDADNPKPLPAAVQLGSPATFQVYTGAPPTRGQVFVRVGLAPVPGWSEAEFAVRLNARACAPVEDLRPDGSFVPAEERDNLVVNSVSEVAPRVAQFEATFEAATRGYNTVEVSLLQGSEQSVIWLEIYFVP